MTGFLQRRMLPVQLALDPQARLIKPDDGGFTELRLNRRRLRGDIKAAHSWLAFISAASAIR